jgi:hypothetical protein
MMRGSGWCGSSAGDSGSVVTWRQAQMVLLSAQGMDVPAIANVAFTSEDRVRDVIRNFNADGFSSLYPKYAGGHPPKFTLNASGFKGKRLRAGLFLVALCDAPGCGLVVQVSCEMGEALARSTGSPSWCYMPECGDECMGAGFDSRVSVG